MTAHSKGDSVSAIGSDTLELLFDDAETVSWTDTYEPGAGEMICYLVPGVTSIVEGSLGVDSTGAIG